MSLTHQSAQASTLTSFGWVQFEV